MRYNMSFVPHQQAIVYWNTAFLASHLDILSFPIRLKKEVNFFAQTLLNRNLESIHPATTTTLSISYMQTILARKIRIQDEITFQ